MIIGLVLVLGRATLVTAKEGEICYLAIVPTPLEYIVVIEPLLEETYHVCVESTLTPRCGTYVCNMCYK